MAHDAVGRADLKVFANLANGRTVALGLNTIFNELEHGSLPRREGFGECGHGSIPWRLGNERPLNCNTPEQDCNTFVHKMRVQRSAGKEAKAKVRRPTSKVQGPRSKVQGPRSKV